MRTKKKRGGKKPTSQKPSVEAAQNEEACSNFVTQNDRQFNQHYSDTNSEDDGSSSSSYSSESDVPFNVEDIVSSDDSSVDRRSRRSVKGGGKVNRKANEPEGSRILSSSTKKRNESRTVVKDSCHNSKELKAALIVIKKVMEMDEAKPFNVPMDPAVLRRPDYYNIIHTPMDFGMISSTLQKGTKYTNSEDVFNDVDYIWENCLKLFKKGEYTVYLMKRVKKKFMKYWEAAGLCRGGSKKHKADDIALQLSTRSYSQVYNSQQLLPSSTGPKFSQTPLSYNHPYQSQQPPLGSNQQQFLPLQAGSNCNSAGHSHFQQPRDLSQISKNHAPGFPACPITGGTSSESLPLQNQFSRKQPSDLQPPQESVSQPQPLLKTCAGTGHSHSPSSMDHMRCSGLAPWHPVDPMVIGPSQLKAQSSQLSFDHLKKPSNTQANCIQPQALGDQADVGESSRLSLTDSATRGIRCAMAYALCPCAARYCRGKQDDMGPAEHLHEENPHSQNQCYQSKKLTKNTESRRYTTKNKKNGRGVTRCLFLRDLEDGKRIFVPVNELGQPVGPESSKLSSFLGTLARKGHIAPLDYAQWRLLPETYKEHMWQLVQEKFDIDPNCKAWVLQSIGNKWRNWKAHLKVTYFDARETAEERLKDHDPRVLPEHWSYLVAYWKSDKAKKHCAINRANREKYKGVHASGTKSYATIREEERRKRSDGKEPTRAELYVLTHTKKDGQPVDEIAAETIAKLREHEAKKLQGSECSNDGNDTFCEVMGEEKSSHLHSYGPGPKSVNFAGKKRSRRDFIIMVSEAKKSANEGVSRVMDKMEAMEEKYSRLETQITTMNSTMQNFMEKIARATNVLGLLDSEQVLNTSNSREQVRRPHTRSSSSRAVGGLGMFQ